MKRLLLIALSVFTVVMNTKAADEIIPIKQILASNSYIDQAISTEHLYSNLGMSPNPPVILSESTFQRVGWNAWHTQGDDNSNVTLLIEFNAVCTIDQLYIWNFNQTNEGGGRDIKDITITFSNNSTNGSDGTWTTLGDFTIPQSPANGLACGPQMVIPFEEAMANFVKINVHSSYGGLCWGFGKLFFTRPESQQTGIGELRAAVTEANRLKFYNYTDGSWVELESALKAAQALIDSDSDDNVVNQNALYRLIDAQNDLITKTNIAIGSNAVSDDYYENMSDYNAQKAVDQNFSSRWATNKSQSASIIISKSAPITFNQICLFEYEEYAGRMQSVKIEVSDNMTDWTEWGEKNVRGTYVSAVGEEITTYYIKLEITQHNNLGINLAEVMIFNDPTATETGDPTPPRPIDPNWITQQPGTSPDVYHVRKAGIKYGMFIHYGINTFVNQEWTDGSYAPSTYNPNIETLDPDSWVKAAYEGGMNFIILITKHHDGFALWDTEVGTYNINNTGRPGANRDIVKEVADACKKYGIKLGLYYSIWDRNWDRNNTAASLGTDAEGRNQIYNDFALAHIKELLDGRYGDICELWIDGAWVKNNEEWEFDRMYDVVKTLQPHCAFTVNCTIKNPNNGNWVLDPAQANGGEEMYFFPSDFRLMDGYMSRPGADADPKVYSYNNNKYYLPFEATICINSSWFWNPTHSQATVKSASSIAANYKQLIAQDNTLVMNLSPTTNGIFSPFDVEGLYAAARLLGIERGDARLNINPNECEVEIRYETTTGQIAFPTSKIYGTIDESYYTTHEDLGLSGYRLATTPENKIGIFGTQKQVVTYIYEDYGAPIVSNIATTEQNTDFKITIEFGITYLTSKIEAKVDVTDMKGVLLLTKRVKAGEKLIIHRESYKEPVLIFTKGINGAKKAYKIMY